MKRKTVKGWVIVNDIPIPMSKRSAINARYPFKDMKVGESFLYVKLKDATEGKQRSIATAARVWKNKTGRKSWHFIARQTDEGIRVWRVK